MPVTTSTQTKPSATSSIQKTELQPPEASVLKAEVLQTEVRTNLEAEQSQNADKKSQAQPKRKMGQTAEQWKNCHRPHRI